MGVDIVISYYSTVQTYDEDNSEKYMIYFNNLYVFDHQFTVGKINNIFTLFSGRKKG